jgi:hypothetical protein
MTTWKIVVGLTFSLLACATVVISIYAHQLLSVLQQPTRVPSAQQEPMAKKMNANDENNSPLTTTDVNGAAAAYNNLVGVWNETDLTDASSTITMNGAYVPIHSFEFRSDGTFAEKSYGRLLDYPQKCNQFDGSCSSTQFPASATSTGFWSVGDISELSKEMITIDLDKPPVPASTLLTEQLPPGTIFLKLDTGDGRIEDLGAQLSDDKNTLNLLYLLGGDPYGEYKRFTN